MTIFFFILTFSLWAIVHSLFASHTIKTWMRSKFGQRVYDGWYRLFYNVVAIVTFVPALYFYIRLSNRVLWAVGVPWDRLFWTIKIAGIIGLAISLYQTDIWRFAGIRQAIRFLKGESHINLPAVFIRKGLYNLVRHPLYFFSLLFIWFNPVMTLTGFIFNVVATLYFWFGSIPEENKLIAAFGEPYKIYQKEVPRLLPLKRPGFRNQFPSKGLGS